MTHDRDDADEDALAGIDLHAWRVPPPVAVHRPSLLVRALSPDVAPARRLRIGWIMAAIVLVNAAIATLLVILLARSPAMEPYPSVPPAGGGSIDAQVRDLLQRLAKEQRELERRLTEIEELRALVVELSEKVRKYEQQDGRRERTVPKQRKRQTADRIDRQPVDPYDNAIPTDLGSCDEVSCVLTNYAGTCCAKFRSPGAPITHKNPPADDLPDTLDRTSITKGIASVKARVAACAERSTAKGKVKVRVRVAASGNVSTMSVEATPDPALGACVAAALRQAVFPRTQNGGAFSYPFVF